MERLARLPPLGQGQPLDVAGQVSRQAQCVYDEKSPLAPPGFLRLGSGVPKGRGHAIPYPLRWASKIFFAAVVDQLHRCQHVDAAVAAAIHPGLAGSSGTSLRAALEP